MTTTGNLSCGIVAEMRDLFTWEQAQVAQDVDHGGSAFFATTVSLADLA